jgi:hypothetical protein
MFKIVISNHLVWQDYLIVNLPLNIKVDFMWRHNVEWERERGGEHAHKYNELMFYYQSA